MSREQKEDCYRGVWTVAIINPQDNTFLMYVILEREEKMERKDLPRTGSLPKKLQHLELSQSKIKSWELLLGLPHRGMGPRS